MAIFHTAVIVALTAIVIWLYIQSRLTTIPDPVVGGRTHKDFKVVEEIFRRSLEDGRLQGGAVAAYYKGELVVDLWGGYADLPTQRPWKEDTMNMFYSTTKAVGAIVIAHLVDKGLLDYDSPVSRYWPEFAQNNKGEITVEMLMSHQAGLSYLDEPVSLFNLRDNPEVFEQVLARQTPAYEPGSKFGYHTQTFGLYVDTLAKKVDPKHRNMSQIFDEDIAKPFGIEFYIGLPRELFHRKATVTPLTPARAIWRTLTSGDLAALNFLYISLPLSGSVWLKTRSVIKESQKAGGPNDPDVCSIGYTSGGGFGTAREVAKLFSILANGGTYKGKQLLSPKAIKRLGTRLVEGMDETLQMHIKLGPGVFISQNPKGQAIFGHPGLGSQIALSDPHTGLSFAYTTPYHSIHHIWDDPILLSLQNAVYSSITQ